MSNTTNPIHTQGLSKSFGKSKVINDLSFDVLEGDVFAFLGANGSGKTTTIRCLLGIYKQDAGVLRVFGSRYTPELAHLLGYLPEERGLYTSSKVLETLVYFGQLKGQTAAQATKQAKDYLERVDLAGRDNQLIKSLSSGQQQKIQLGVAIMNNPKLLILDEPTKGLDPVNRNLLMDVLNELSHRGTTIVFSTHQMEMAERIANRMILIKDGKSALYGDLDKVKQSFGTDIIHLEYSGTLQLQPKLFTATLEKNHAEITPAKGVSTKEILKYLVDAGLSISKYQVSSPSLQEIFVTVNNSNE